MLLGRTNIISTSQDAPMYTWGQSGIANSAGGGAGQSVTVAVSFPTSMAYPNGYPVPAYVVQVQPSQGCLTAVSGKTQLGFNVILTCLPRITPNRR